MKAHALDCGDASRRSPSDESERWLSPPQSRAALLALLLFATFHLSAAIPTTSITGRVTSGGAAAANVTVTLTSSALQGERTTTTTSTGRYWLTGLPAGRYDVTFSRAKLQTLTKRVVVELGRTARADATLEPSDDEESITATATTVNVTETAAATSHFSDEMLDRLPIERDPVAALLLAPGISGGFAGYRNGAADLGLGLFGSESLEEVTIVRAALPAEYDAYSPPLFFSRSRSGGEEEFFSIRDSITSGRWVSSDFPGLDRFDDVDHLFEANAGGRIVRDKLWFFAGAWHGSEIFGYDRKGYEAKLTWQPHAQHNLMAFFTEGEAETGLFNPDARIAALRYTGTPTARLTTEAVLSRSGTGLTNVAGPPQDFSYHYDSLFAKASYAIGDHVLSAGGRAYDDSGSNDTSFFLNDRWSLNRLTLNLGARHELDRVSPRVAASFDLRGNGRQAIIASLSDYPTPLGLTRELSLGFATAIGTTGSIRIDAVRRDLGEFTLNGAQADFRYTLFDRFHTGGSYTWFDPDPLAGGVDSEHNVHAWAGVDLPVFDDHEFGVTAMQHFRSDLGDGLGHSMPTDLALRYSLPVSRVRVTVAADVVNVFDERDHTFATGRMFRGWVRLRH